MNFSKAFYVVALLLQSVSPAWAEPVHFCKVSRILDPDIRVPDKKTYEDCSGVSLLWYAKDYVKAACWDGAVEVLPGKCPENNEAGAVAESPKTEPQAPAAHEFLAE